MQKIWIFTGKEEDSNLTFVVCCLGFERNSCESKNQNHDFYTWYVQIKCKLEELSLCFGGGIDSETVSFRVVVCFRLSRNIV